MFLVAKDDRISDRWISLQANADKTKYTNNSKYKYKNRQRKTQDINHEEYQEVSEFKYMVSLVTYGNDCGKLPEQGQKQEIGATSLSKKLLQ